MGLDIFVVKSLGKQKTISWVKRIQILSYILLDFILRIHQLILLNGLPRASVAASIVEGRLQEGNKRNHLSARAGATGADD